MSRSRRVGGVRVLCSLHYSILPTSAGPLFSTQSVTLRRRGTLLPTLSLSLDFDVGPLNTLTPLGGANACYEISHKVQLAKEHIRLCRALRVADADPGVRFFSLPPPPPIRMCFGNLSLQRLSARGGRTAETGGDGMQSPLLFPVSDGA